MQALITYLSSVHWATYTLVFEGLWSVFWSFAPSPMPNTWYNAVFHTAQFMALNPGRSLGVMRSQATINGIVTDAAMEAKTLPSGSRRIG